MFEEAILLQFFNPEVVIKIFYILYYRNGP